MKKECRIIKHTYGQPLLKTYAVVKEVEESDQLPYFSVEKNDTISFRCPLSSDDYIYGFGQAMGGLNKNGCLYVSYATDNPRHRENSVSLYGAHNFFVLDGHEHFGMFFDTPSRITFDMGHTNPDEIYIHTSNPNLEVYCIEADDTMTIVRAFLDLCLYGY